MSLKGTKLSDIDEQRLAQLIANEVREGRDIEYKSQLRVGSRDEKLEFLADVTSFANSNGGDIVYGVEEQHGCPVHLRGVGDLDLDDEKLRIANLVRDAVAPRLPRLDVIEVPLADGGYVIVVRVAASQIAPHIVTFGGSMRTYSRTPAGKYPLDVNELRNRFLRAAETADRIRELRARRVAAILADETPIEVDGGPRLIVHFVPFSAFEPGHTLPIASIDTAAGGPAPLQPTGQTCRFNFDGLLTYNYRDAAGTDSYLQVFKTGVLEAVETRILAEQRNGARIFWHPLLVDTLSDAVVRYLQLLVSMDVTAPVAVIVTLAGVAGFEIYREPRVIVPHYVAPVDRDNLYLQEVVVSDLTSPDVPAIIRPIMDAIWNAAGYSRCELPLGDEDQADAEAH